MIKRIYPKSDIQLCISAHDKEQPQVRKADLPCGTLESAEAALLRFAEKWNDKYPAIYALWERI